MISNNFQFHSRLNLKPLIATETREWARPPQQPALLNPPWSESACFHVCTLLCCLLGNDTESLQSCLTLCGPMDRSPLSMGFSRKNSGVGCQFLLQEIVLTQAPNPRLVGLLHWQAGFFFLPLALPGKLLLVNADTEEKTTAHWGNSGLLGTSKKDVFQS